MGGFVREHGKALVAVMAGLVPAIHVLLCHRGKTWMPGTRLHKAGHDEEKACPIAPGH